MHAIVCDRWKISNRNILKLMDFCFIWFFSISSSFYLHTFSKPSYSSNAYTAGHHRQKTSFVFSAVCWTFSANVSRFIMCMNLEAHSMDLLLWETNLWTQNRQRKFWDFIFRFRILCECIRETKINFTKSSNLKLALAHTAYTDKQPKNKRLFAKMNSPASTAAQCINLIYKGDRSATPCQWTPEKFVCFKYVRCARAAYFR